MKIESETRFSSAEALSNNAVTGDRAVSVAFVVPVRNDAIRLRRCLESIVSNRYPRTAIELLVVDNDSTDDSAEVARAYADAVVTRSGISVAALRNFGARQTRAPIVAFVDADHAIDSSWIAAAAAALAAPAVAAAGFPYDTQPDANRVQRLYDAMRQRPASQQTVSWLGSGNIAVKRECFDAVGGFREDLVACEDVDFCNRLIQAGYSVIADPGMRSTHYGDPGSLRALFYGELWRGRDNLRVTFSGPRTARNLRSALIPVVGLICIAGTVAALLGGQLLLAAAFSLVPMAAALFRAVIIYTRQQNRGPRALGESLALALVFDLARSLAIVIPGSHGARRA